MIFPPLLKANDKVGILAPARKINKEDVDFAVHVLSSWGVEVVLSKNLFSEKHNYLSGTDDERLSDFQEMLNDSSIKAIFCARGGYGSTRIVDDITYSSLAKNPKWLIGFSDITAFHLKFIYNDIASIHGTMPVLFSKRESKSSVESLRGILFDGKCSIESPPFVKNHIGRVSGIVVGGNLSLLADAVGTSSEPDTDNKILIIEEIDEYRYKIDRMMTQLRRTGKFKNLAGLVVGHMTDIKDSELSFGESVEEIILNAVKEYSYPVAFKFPTGHENPNLAWINGGHASLDVTSSGTSLVFDPLKKDIV